MTDNYELDNNTTDDDRKILTNMRRLRILNVWYVRLFVVTALFMLVLSLIIPLRPKYSESEKRELARFPKFKFSAFFSGDYFDGINEWYADTFPLREKLTDINTAFTGLYGKTEVKVHGTVEKGDEIPSENTPSSEASKPQETVSSAVPDTTSSEVSSENKTNSSQAQPSTPPKEEKPTAQTLGALLINGDTAYEYYNFVKATADSYASAVNRAAVLLSGKSEVYCMVVPTSMGICVPDSLLATVNTSNQRDAINYMYSGMKGGGVKTVSLFDTLKAHKNEYIYFRTDHHWTALGAYYAYADFIKLKGGAPKALTDFKEHSFPGYLGSFYTSSKKLPQLATNPDTVYAYEPVETNSIEIHYENGQIKMQEIISDMSKTSQSTKYLTFIKGDRPLSIITNPTLNDGSCCVVIKESFGNALVPFLVPHYQKLYVVDYRYFSKIDQRGLVQLCTDIGAKDVLFINNISATRNKSLVASINSLVR